MRRQPDLACAGLPSTWRYMAVSLNWESISWVSSEEEFYCFGAVRGSLICARTKAMT